MGFGLLLIGYFLSFATSLASFYFYADIFGAAIMVYSLIKLSRYSDKFKNSIPSALIFTVMCMIGAMLTLFDVSAVVMNVVSTARAASILMLHIYLFTALEDMARGADDVKLASRAKRNLYVVGVYYLVYIALTALGGYFDETLRNYFTVIMFFYGIVMVVMNLLLLHSAYCRLYIEGTEERYAENAQFKESKIPFISKIQKRYYESQKKAYEENYKLMKETRDYISANRDKIPQKKNKKKKK